jgi:hypothetical protein
MVLAGVVEGRVWRVCVGVWWGRRRSAHDRLVGKEARGGGRANERTNEQNRDEDGAR